MAREEVVEELEEEENETGETGAWENETRGKGIKGGGVDVDARS